MNKVQTIKGNWVINNITDHFTKIMSAGISKKRQLLRTKKYEENKNKKLKYVLQSTGNFKKTRKNEKNKNVVNVYYD